MDSNLKGKNERYKEGRNHFYVGNGSSGKIN